MALTILRVPRITGTALIPFLSLVTSLLILKDVPDAYEVEVQLKEARFVTGGTGFNVGNNEGSADFGINLNNLTGRADRLRWNLSRTSQGSATYNLGYALPLFGDVYSPLNLSLSKVCYALLEKKN